MALIGSLASKVKKTASVVKKTTAKVSTAVKKQAAKKTTTKTATKTAKNPVTNAASAVSAAIRSAQETAASVANVANQASHGIQQQSQAVSPAKSTAAAASGSAASSGGKTEETIPEFKARELSPPPTMEDYLKSGFYASSGISALQEQLARYNLSDAEIRSQAEALYQPTFSMQKTAFENQLAELDASRNRDIQKLNSQYGRTLNGVMAGLNKQGLGRSSLVATRGVETENARNAAISDTSYNYLQQQNEVNANRQKAEAEYAQNVENKATEIRNQNNSQRIALMSQIAQMQQSGYSAYVTYLQNKEKQEIENEYTEYVNKYLKK